MDVVRIWLHIGHIALLSQFLNSSDVYPISSGDIRCHRQSHSNEKEIRAPVRWCAHVSWRTYALSVIQTILVRVLPLIQTWSSPKSLRQESFIFSLSEEGWEGRTEIQSSQSTSIISSQILISELRRMICISNTLVHFWLSKFAVSSLINSLSMFTWRTTSLLCEGVRRRAFCFSSIPKICSESVQVDIIFRFDESFEETDWIFESSPPCP